MTIGRLFNGKRRRYWAMVSFVAVLLGLITLPFLADRPGQVAETDQDEACAAIVKRVRAELEAVKAGMSADECARRLVTLQDDEYTLEGAFAVFNNVGAPETRRFVAKARRTPAGGWEIVNFNLQDGGFSDTPAGK
jgi:hypothetical protein